MSVTSANDRFVHHHRRGLRLASLFAILSVGCTQALGLDDPATLLADSGGAGGTTATSVSQSAADGVTSAGPTAAVTNAVASSSTGAGCGTCPAPGICETMSCDAGQCVNHPLPSGAACAGGTCDENQICQQATCTLQTQCAATDYCDGANCQTKKPKNEPCSQGYECTSGTCVSSKCKP